MTLTLQANIDVSTLTQKEGADLLVKYLDAAKECFADADQSLTQGILHLDFVREQGLYAFQYEDWKDCLDTFMAEKGVGRSTTFNLLKAVRMWRHALEKDPAKLLEYAEGIRTIAPVLDGSDSMVAKHDRQTGEIVKLKNGWDKALPPGETPGLRVAQWIDENVATEATAAIVRHSIHQEQPDKDEVRFFFMNIGGGGHPTQISWQYERVNGEYEEGICKIEWNMPDEVWEEFRKRLRCPSWL